ncbi:MAG: DegV family protein [Acholeplasma sp.]|nr:DegV family protein [Acholeplasma sp.]
MNPVKIITDSTADLSRELLEEFDIVSLPLLVRFGEESYRDGIDITTDKLYELVEEKGELPKTSAISPGIFYQEFKKWIDLGYDIVYTGIGSKISGTFHSANVAREGFPDNRIFLVDSLNLSSGIALLLLKAKDLRDQGKSAKVIYDELMDTVPRVRSQFAIKVLDYLHKGGRASGLSALVGKFLRVRPIIQVREGKLDVYKKPMGKMLKAVDLMLEDYFVENDNIDLEYVMITHTMAYKQAAYMENKVREQLMPKELIISEAGCVISSHCGAGTIGILYIVKK